jgi:hypothetical protein
MAVSFILVPDEGSVQIIQARFSSPLNSHIRRFIRSVD